MEIQKLTAKVHESGKKIKTTGMETKACKILLEKSLKITELAFEEKEKLIVKLVKKQEKLKAFEDISDLLDLKMGRIDSVHEQNLIASKDE